MRARLDERDAESERVRDLRVRSALEVAQHQHNPVRSGQLVDRRAQGRPQLRLIAGLSAGRDQSVTGAAWQPRSSNIESTSSNEIS